MAKFVDTARMAALISIIEGNIKDINTIIEGYSASAPSLGQSSFRGSVESNLGKIKTTYAETFNPPLDKLQNTLNEVKEAYDLGATQIENTTL